MSGTKSTRQLIDDAYVAILQNGDVDGFLADFAEDGQLIEAPSLPYGGTYTGVADIKAAMLRIFEYWQDFSYTVEHIVYDEEWTMAYGRFAATARKTGIRVDFPLAEIWRIKDGKIASVSPIYSDTKKAIDALG